MKRKAAIIILTAILIVSFHDAIYAQEFYGYHPDRNVVMAANGLNMRSQPNTSSTKLVNIPYGEQVRILHKDHYGLDTIYTIKTEMADHPVYGYWQKVQYGEYVGYVHNAFLSMFFHYERKLMPGTNEDFVFLKPGYDCADEFHNPNEYIWYGYYQEKTAAGVAINKPYRQQIDVQFINVAAEMSGSGTIVKKDRHLRFIIGSKKVLPETDMETIFERPLYSRIEETSPVVLDSSLRASGIITIVENEDPENDFPSFYLCQGNKEQLINKNSETYTVFLGHEFIQADLDGDGKMDYIFNFNQFGFARGLLLSSEADEKEIAKLVSLMERGPCC